MGSDPGWTVFYDPQWPQMTLGTQGRWGSSSVMTTNDPYWPHTLILDFMDAWPHLGSDRAERRVTLNGVWPWLDPDWTMFCDPQWPQMTLGTQGQWGSFSVMTTSDTYWPHTLIFWMLDPIQGQIGLDDEWPSMGSDPDLTLTGLCFVTLSDPGWPWEYWNRGSVRVIQCHDPKMTLTDPINKFLVTSC